MSAGWRDALDCQLQTRRHVAALLEYVAAREAPYGRRALGEHYAARVRTAGDEVPEDGLRGWGELTMGIFRHSMVTMLETAEPILVSEPVTELVSAAQESFNVETPHAWDAFVPSGFALFSRPVELPEAKHPIYALGWVPIVLRDDDDPEVIHVTTWFLREGDAGLEPGTELVVIAGREPPDRPAEGTEDGWAIQRLMQTFWRLAKQVIRVAERSPRPVRRAAQRMGMEREGVLVVRLRKQAPAPSNGEPSPVDWQHQWVVRGHWRNQWFPAHGVHRQIWIAPYVKGPEDRPLKPVTGRAWEFVR